MDLPRMASHSHQSRQAASSPLAEASREDLRRGLLACGFTRCAFTRPSISASVRQQYTAWVESGAAADMTWMVDSLEDRCRPEERFPEARTAVCFALAYDRPEPREGGVLPGVSRYAQGRAYHNVMRRRLRRAGEVLASAGASFWVAWADTGPVLEKPLAEAAGLGWIGKHTLLLDREWGSYLFLAVGFTDLDISSDGPATDHCGSCTACLDACPTGALFEAGRLDPARCISYLNIEHRGAFDSPFDASLEGWLHGCDDCQEACPFVQAARRRGRIGDPDFAPRRRWQSVGLEELNRIDEGSWDRLTRGSAVRRGGPGRLRRVARRLLEDSGRVRREGEHP